MFHISKGIQYNQNEIMGRALLVFKGDIAYFTWDTIVVAHDSSQHDGVIK